MKPARIIVLIIALAAGGMAAMLAGRSDRPAEPVPEPVAELETVDVLVAEVDMTIGHRITDQELRWQMWPAAAAAGPAYVRKAERPDAIHELSGAITRSTVTKGEPIREARLARVGATGYMAAVVPEGMRAISTVVSTDTTAGGFILPNDHVDVILTRRDRDQDKSRGELHHSEIILSNIRVLAIDQVVEEKDGQQAITNSKTATLELTPPQTEVLARAAEMGKLTLTLRSIMDFGKKGPAVTSEDRRSGGINVVRFGINTAAAAK